MIQNARIIEANKADIVTVERKGKNIFVINVVVRGYRNIKVDAIGKFKSCTDFGVARRWDFQATVIPVITGTLSSIQSHVISHSNINGMKPSIPSLQMSIENDHYKRSACENEKSFG